MRPAGQTCIIVAGMHRSGTSAFTRVLNLLGADLPKRLMPPAPNNNENGFWEPARLVAVHDELLEAMGSAWDDPLPLPDHWLQSDAARQARQRLSEEVGEDFGSSRVFVLKDPRICRLLPLWLDLLDEQGIEPAVVIPVRNPLEIAASLGKRDRMAHAKALLLYLRSMLEAELASRGRRRLFASYRELVADWRPFSTRLKQLIGAMPCAQVQSPIDIDVFLSGDHYHNRFADEELGRLADVPASVIEVHELLSKAAGSGEDESLKRAFDQLRARLDAATGLFQGWALSEKDTARREALAQSSSEISRLGDELSSSRGRVTELEAVLAIRSREIVEMGEKIRIEAGNVARLRRDLTETEQEVATLKVKMAEVEASTSWRVTAPMRSLGDAIKGLRRAGAGERSMKPTAE